MKKKPSNLGTLKMNNEETNAITRHCIENALVILMNEMPFDRIGISDIARKAGVSRNAYYRNYASKEEILEKFMQNMFEDFSNVMKKYNALTETTETWIALLTSTKNYSSQYELLLKAGYGDKMMREYVKLMNREVAGERTELYYSNCYWAGAICAILTAWIESRMNVSIDKLASICARLMTDGIRTAIEYGNKCE